VDLIVANVLAVLVVEVVRIVDPVANIFYPLPPYENHPNRVGIIHATAKKSTEVTNTPTVT
jgi:hypothetical protein